MSTRILVAEDDPAIRQLLADLLQGEGYDAVSAEDGEKAILAWEEAVRGGSPFDLLLLDIMMPKASGYDVLKRVRRDDDRVAVLMLSAKSEEIDKVVGLELGADDYVTKPFGVRELLARIAAVLRRSSRPSADGGAPAGANGGADAAAREFPFCGATVSGKTYTVVGPSGEESLTDTEMRLCRFLAERPGEAIPRDRLLDGVWGENYFGTTRTLDQHVANLRRKVERVGGDPGAIGTLHGIGYILRL